MPECKVTRYSHWATMTGFKQYGENGTFVGKLHLHKECFSNGQEKNATYQRMHLLPDIEGAPSPHLESFNSSHIPYGVAKCVVRGKELVITVHNVIIRINFGLEGHLLWMSTKEYDAITANGPEVYGTVGGQHYCIPKAILSNAVQKAKPIYLRPLLALIGKSHTLAVVDHNALAKLTIGCLTRPIEDSDLIPTSNIYPQIWSSSHGPDWITESTKAEAGYWNWLAANTNSKTPIYTAIQDQSMANGIGTWHASDILHLAIIVPSQPVSHIAQNKKMSQRLFEALKIHFHSYNPDWTKSTKSLLLKTVLHSSGGTFAFNEQGHKSWLTSGCKVYRKSGVTVTREWADQAQKLGVLNSNWTLQSNGTAIWKGPEGRDPSKPLPLTLTLPVRRSGLFYTAIQAKVPGINYEPVLPKDSIDGPGFRCKTTIGPYSFAVFVAGRILQVPQGKPRIVKGSGPGRPRKLLQSTIDKNTSIPKYRKSRAELEAAKQQASQASKHTTPEEKTFDERNLEWWTKRSITVGPGHSLSSAKKR